MSRVTPEKRREYDRRWREKNPEKARKISQQWREANPEYKRQWRQENQDKVARHGRKWRQKNRDHIREYKRQWQYNLTPAQYQHLLEKQSFKCASCGVNFATLSADAISIDHCHKTNKVRGILCRSCNLALGLMNDDLVKIRKLAKYIAKFG